MSSSSQDDAIPAHFFARQDETPDEQFYTAPRFEAHIDQATIDALTDYYRSFIPANARVLDLMSSWISHLPDDVTYQHVTGLGMNREELEANKQLDAFCVQNLNEDPLLPYPAGSFDRVMIVVSVQYLIRPIEVMRSIYDVLDAQGALCIAMSHRLFPTKAVAAFQQLPRKEWIQLVGYYVEQAGFSDVAFEDRSPANADPLWLLTGRKPSQRPNSH
jgi:SAM-dependent methyltransferase